MIIEIIFLFLGGIALYFSHKIRVSLFEKKSGRIAASIIFMFFVYLVGLFFSFTFSSLGHKDFLLMEKHPIIPIKTRDANVYVAVYEHRFHMDRTTEKEVDYVIPIDGVKYLNTSSTDDLQIEFVTSAKNELHFGVLYPEKSLWYFRMPYENLALFTQVYFDFLYKKKIKLFVQHGGVVQGRIIKDSDNNFSFLKQS